MRNGGYAPVPEEVIEYLKKNGGILWEPGKEGREGWAICPCCGERELHVILVAEDE